MAFRRKLARVLFGPVVIACTSGSERYNELEQQKRFSSYVVEGRSMEPIIHHGDKVRIEHAPFFHYAINREDIVVANVNNECVVKVVKYLPNEYVPFQQTNLDKGEFWLEGTNADIPFVDSRNFGPVSLEQIIGRVVYIDHREKTPQQ